MPSFFSREVRIAARMAAWTLLSLMGSAASRRAVAWQPYFSFHARPTPGAEAPGGG